MMHGLSRPSAPVATQSALILVVDDDQFMGEAMAYALESSGYRAHVCGDALEALEFLRAGELPDLIVLDLVMPRMNGWEFRVAQRRDPRWKEVPLIVMSADSSPQAAAIDADAYLQKPVGRELLLSSVQQVLREAEERRAAARNAELERLSSLGLIAAGIAHEINNPLAFVLGNLELARTHLRQLEAEVEGVTRARVIAVSRLMSQAETGAERVAGVVRSVAAFSRPDSDTQTAIDVIEALESSIQLVNNELRHHARLERVYEAPPPVLGNAAKLGQVFVNLLSNAIQAVSDTRGRDHVIGVHAFKTPQGDAKIVVSDTGPGIPPGLLPRIFDPFFSTKPVGRGMGLGLAICHRLVVELHGTIAGYNGDEHGACFAVTLPGMSEPAPPPVRESPAEARRSYARRPAILVIDDEPMMCEMLEVTLRDEYAVTSTASAREALLRLGCGESYDVILCDLMMPDVSGMDVHAELSRSRPDQAARMVFMTGGTFTEDARAFLEALTVGHLQKPFRPPDVFRIIARALDVHGLSGSPARLN